MPRTKLMIIIVAVFAIGSGVIYLALGTDNSQTDKAIMAVNTPKKKQPTSQTQTPTEPAASAGKYVDYNNGIVAETPGTKLLFFHAPWCPQCKALDADVRSGAIPDGVTIIKTDYDSNQTLRQKYGVTIQTTIVRVDDHGNLIKKFVAYQDPSLKAVINELL